MSIVRKRREQAAAKREDAASAFLRAFLEEVRVKEETKVLDAVEMIETEFRSLVERNAAEAERQAELATEQMVELRRVEKAVAKPKPERQVARLSGKLDELEQRRVGLDAAEGEALLACRPPGYVAEIQNRRRAIVEQISEAEEALEVARASVARLQTLRAEIAALEQDRAGAVGEAARLRDVERIEAVAEKMRPQWAKDVAALFARLEAHRQARPKETTVVIGPGLLQPDANGFVHLGGGWVSTPSGAVARIQ